jgi:hypothetical protein
MNKTAWRLRNVASIAFSPSDVRGLFDHRDPVLIGEHPAKQFGLTGQPHVAFEKLLQGRRLLTR